MSNFLVAGSFPGCYQLWTKAVPCDVGEFHYHVLDGGAQLTRNLDLKEPQLEIPYECKSRLVQRVMPSSQEVGLMPWNCPLCSSDGPTPMLHPEAQWCNDCGTEKLASAEAVLSTYIQGILDTWRGNLAEEISNLVVSTVSAEEIREMVWHTHGRLNSGLMVSAWNDAHGQAALE